jgi:hypothetical protein
MRSEPTRSTGPSTSAFPYQGVAVRFAGHGETSRAGDMDLDVVAFLQLKRLDDDGGKA